MRKIWGAAGLAALALTVSACASSSSSSAAASNTPAAAGAAARPRPRWAGTGTTLDAATVGGQFRPVTNSAGFDAVLVFAPDTRPTGRSALDPARDHWPAGHRSRSTAGSGVTGTLGTITRSDGTTQATYDGHPLYTYAADTAAGQAKGNGLNVSGGLWYEMTVSGATPAAGAAASASASTSKGGYGY